MEPFSQYFHMVLFISYIVLTFESVKEILWWDHSNETSLMVLSRGSTCLYTTLTLGLWRKCYDVTIQRKPLLQYFHMVLFVCFPELIFAKCNLPVSLILILCFTLGDTGLKELKTKCNWNVIHKSINALPQAITTLKFKAYDTSIYKPHYEGWDTSCVHDKKALIVMINF